MSVCRKLRGRAQTRRNVQVMITSVELSKKTGLAIKTLSRWAARGIIPKPAVGTHPNGRGKIGYWPDSVLDRCQRIVALRKKGHELDSALAMLRIEDLHTASKSLDEPTIYDILARKKVALADGRQVDMAQVLLSVFAKDIESSPVDRDFHARILNQIRQKDLLRDALALIEGGYSPVLTFDGTEARVEPDFLLSHIRGIGSFLAVPMRPAFQRFMDAIGGKDLFRKVRITPAPKVWCQEDGVVTEYAVFLGGHRGFELLKETATGIGKLPSDPSRKSEVEHPRGPSKRVPRTQGN
jgi:DNA-binding transcriptional MerR regulator